MNVLIVESKAELASLWARHLERQGATTKVVQDQDSAIAELQDQDFDILVLDIVLKNGSALAVSDYASYRCPGARVIFVTNQTFFSDGSIFAHSSNACAYVKPETPPEDLAAIVEHYAAVR